MESWILFALVAALAKAASPLVSEYFKIRSIELLFWTRIFCLAALLPVAFIIPWPTDPFFYAVMVVVSLIFSYNDIMYTGMATKVGGGAVSRFQPLEIALTFVLWLIISPWLVEQYLEQPLRTAGILLAIGVSVYLALYMRRCPVSAETARRLFPNIIAGATGVILSTKAVQSVDQLSGVAWYAIIQNILMFLFYSVILRLPFLSDRFTDLGDVFSIKNKKVIWAGALMAITWLFHTPFKYMAIYDVENPAYVTMIGLTAPFWILLVYKLTGRREEANIWPGVGIVICAVILVLLTQI